MLVTNLGSGTNEDRIIVVRAEEEYLFEDPNGPYLMTFPDTGSSTLTVRFRIHQYVAATFARRPKAAAVVAGSGLASPSF